MEDLINTAIKFAKENNYEILIPKDKESYLEINTIRIVGKEKAVYFEIE